MKPSDGIVEKKLAKNDDDDARSPEKVGGLNLNSSLEFSTQSTKPSDGREEEKLAQEDENNEEEEMLKMAIAIAPKKEAGLNLQKGKTKKHTHLNP